MIREIHILPKHVHARIRVPGSKSIANRALVCAALANGESRISNASDSNDTALMANGLNQLGVLVRKNDDVFIVEGTGGRLFAPKFPIPVGNAGTTLRFMLSVASLANGTTIFEGDPRMAERPIDDLLHALRMLGVESEAGEHQARYSVKGGSMNGGTSTVKAEKSSQFLSSLLMVAPYARNDVTINVSGGVSSASYVEITLDVMQKFGVHVSSSSGRSFEIQSGRRYTPIEFHVEADASGASYFLAAAAICGGEVFVEGLKKTSLQGDAQFIDILEQMGCAVAEDATGVRLKSSGEPHGVDVDMNSMPDVVPTLAVTALFAATPTRIRNVAHLRHKESDRLHALETELRKCGAHITAHTDGLEIHPAPLHGVVFDTYDDHRLAMCFSLVGLKTPGVKIENPDCVVKSFPKFWSEWEKLYGRQ